jgi:DNA-binding response OmpR family regulator
MINFSTDISKGIPIILIADDDRSMRSLLNLALSEEGYQVIETKNGEQCLAEYTRLQPDIILLDAMMPDLDGLTCCDRIRQLPRGKNVPILMITVLDDHESVEKAFAAGITDYITKPINWTVLVQRVRHLLMINQALVSAELATEKLHQQLAWEKLFRKILQQLSLPVEVRESLPTILADLQSFFQVEQVVFYQENQSVVESIKLGDSSIATRDLPDWFNLIAENAQLDRQEEIITIEDLSQTNLPATAIAQLSELNTRALLIAPVINQNQVKGWLCLHYAQTEAQILEITKVRLSDLAKLIALTLN